ncbi:MAG: SH3 domain-containing protein [Gammaproteobacteria bacterium]|nr:SH3 domain-containing protein [Gammaproteobacteria bacterium]
MSVASPGKKSFRRYVAALYVLGIASPGLLAAQALPESDGREHLGVKSCSASTCHGSITERSVYSVLQNEYHTWTRYDRHSRAYETLLGERSQRIARNLGIGKAHEAKICLDCHADNVEQDRRGSFFNISDGVGCEACHGGAEEWLGPHISASASHAANVDAGMYPTEEPVARAKLCLSCHLGTDDKFASHRIMGAGHPRLSFELATFTELQPAHYKKDADYSERKTVATAPQEWLDGVLVGADQNLAIIEGHYDSGGAFPEIALFDCHSCHHSMEQLRWQASEISGEDQPGRLRLEDSRLRMVALLEQQIMQTTSTEVGLRNLHVASAERGDVKAAASELRRRINDIGSQLRKNANRSGSFVAAIQSAASSGRFNDYADAEQAAMALQVLGGGDTAGSVLKDAFDALEDPDEYMPEQAAAALAGTARPALPRMEKKGAAAPVTSSAGTLYKVLSRSGLRVRALPSLEGRLVGGLAYGDIVAVKEVAGQWSFVLTGDAQRTPIGWVASSELGMESP